MLKIAYLGAGSWGFCLATILARKGHHVTLWSINEPLLKRLKAKKDHPRFPGISLEPTLHFTQDLAEALNEADLIVESVTSSGLESVVKKVKAIETPQVPFVITSKGIEKEKGVILPELAIEILGESCRPLIGCISGPGYAQEVISGMPTSLVASGYKYEVIQQICQAFNTTNFRVYPNRDLKGVSFGGALKNVIAIACGIAEGLDLGWSAKAALITRGLHEIRKITLEEGCSVETIYGLSGLGDLYLTCASPLSRNFRFGKLLAEGLKPEEAEKKIGMVVEGKYAASSCLKIARKKGIPMPITEGIYRIVYENFPINNIVTFLMSREIKEEHL